MKNVKKIITAGILSIGIFLSMTNSNAQTISGNFFGQNAWMPAQIGSTVLNGKLDKHWGDIKESNTTVVRFGGITADRDMPTNTQYIAIIDSIRNNGMEPMIQVPFDNWKYSAQQAAAIVTYINVTMGKNIKYWIIGNEPDLGYSFTNSSQVANYIRPFASAMKAVDPSIKIIGPECAWYNTGVINGLTTPNGPDDITGKDAAGRYYIDVISFHTYPFNGSQTRDQVISKLTAPGSFQDNLSALNTRVASCNSAHGRTGASAIKTAVTEFNIDYKNPTTDNVQGLGAFSFLGGQFIAEIMGIGLKNGLEFMNMWSVIEGNSLTSDIGYIDHTTGKKKPLYYHFKMMAENFKGQMVTTAGNQTNVKTFASQNGQQVAVMIMNQNTTGSMNYTVRLNTSAVSGSNPLKINISAGIATEYNGTIGNQATQVLIFNAMGEIVQMYDYSLTGHALAGSAPTLTQFNTATGIASTGAQAPFELKNPYPNPANGKFTLGLNKGAMPKDEEIQVDVINLLGQVVYSEKHTFQDGKEDIALNPGMANGEYLIRVKEGQKDNYHIKKLIVQQ